MAQQRVVYPNRNGLAHPSSTQIGDGTISPSARGSDRNSLGLEVTPLGPNVRAGDVSRSDLHQQVANRNQSGSRTKTGSRRRVIQNEPQVNPGLPAAPIGPHVRAGDISRSDLHPRAAHPHSGYRHAETNPGLPPAPIGPHMRAGDIDRSDLHPHRFDSNQKFWNRGKSNTTRRAAGAAPSAQPPTATYKNEKSSTDRF